MTYFVCCSSHKDIYFFIYSFKSSFQTNIKSMFILPLSYTENISVKLKHFKGNLTETVLDCGVFIKVYLVELFSLSLNFTYTLTFYISVKYKQLIENIHFGAKIFFFFIFSKNALYLSLQAGAGGAVTAGGKRRLLHHPPPGSPQSSPGLPWRLDPYQGYPQSTAHPRY